MNDVRVESELRRLLEKLCEERLEADEAARLEEIVLADRDALRYYVDYVSLHGSLHWDAAVNNASDSALALPRIFAAANGDDGEPGADVRQTVARRHLETVRGFTIAAAVLVAVGIGVLALRPGPDPRGDIVDVDPGPPRELLPEDDPEVRDPVVPDPIHLDGPIVRRDETPKPRVDDVVQPGPRDEIPAEGSTDAAIVAFIDGQLESGYEGAQVEPSPRADDTEWLRRVHLDLVGHIPAPEVVGGFLADAGPDRRERMVQSLLDDTGYAQHFATTWTNLLVGRRPGEDVDREALQAYLRRSFARNRPWSEVVTEIVAAEGATDENGAANFLVAHVNDQAVPATAITARLFLGVQVQCTQCHEHPFNDWNQNQFWELNAFFKQTDVVRRNGKVVLANDGSGGPTFYDTRRGLTRVAYPRFDGRAVDPAPETNRRSTLAELLVDGENPQLAKSIVNRVWAHFHGRGFTTPVDDMGPHNPPTHPALLARLSEEFVKSGYDLRRLITWVTSSSAYQRTSRFGDGNAIDAPEIGETPIFSRVYVKPMTPEQMYDSLVVATRGDAVDWTRTIGDRDAWIRGFVTPNDTDENDETLTLDGTIPQALAMMNGELTAEGTSLASGTQLVGIVKRRASTTEKIRRAFLTALSREPTDGELDALRRMFRERRGRTAEAESLRDLYWALLNSNEFALVH